MTFSDPYTPTDVRHFECRECSHRHVATSSLLGCPDCGGPVTNLSVPRFQ
jgi:Zn finger protein HypA/HybF involved in hydrogenase expression